ncbi:hypothetical protein PISMIDRAFT_11070 [Pisolithus microcarpus 441]|uniref:CCHC-type domain-containing protein n=1 Tax=Pisolithus microcarpus 441 TaxID=765257 RepID=A0A0C9YEA9_9AGAM|nr:hypothetical protein PISMIDRAFT_11070 [Pisolithus microcarpus 441]
MPGITCFNCSEVGHTAPDCPHPQRDKNKAAVKLWLYAVEVQEEEGQDTLVKEQSEEPDEEKIVNGNHEHKETSDHEEGSQYDKGSLIEEYEVYLEVDDDDKPVACFGAMHEEDESTTSEEKKSAAPNQGVTPSK